MKTESYKLTRKERTQLDRLTRKAGIEVAVAAGDFESKDAEKILLGSPWTGIPEYMNCFPSKFGLKLPSDGQWILVTAPPHCQITVPPFSIWFAIPWTMKPDGNGLAAHRVKIMTPAGELGIFPCEYSPVARISEYIGREKEGILVHQMSGDPVVNTDHLFYLMSRGIPRATATMMLIEQIKDPTYLWFEIAPPYGEYFGRKWPTRERCPFATPLEGWKETE